MAGVIFGNSRGAYYFNTDPTARFFRDEMWIPAFLDHRNPQGWMRSPSDAIEKARSKAREMVRTAANQCPLDESRRAEIRTLVACADRDAEGSGKRS